MPAREKEKRRLNLKNLKNTKIRRIKSSLKTNKYLWSFHEDFIKPLKMLKRYYPNQVKGLYQALQKVEFKALYKVGNYRKTNFDRMNRIFYLLMNTAFTQQQIAEAVGTNRRVVRRTINKYIRRQLIDTIINYKTKNKNLNDLIIRFKKFGSQWKEGPRWW